jgi:hypothetical protein
MDGWLPMSFFIFDSRLGIQLPNLTSDWESYAENEQLKIVYEWEQIRGSIPTRIFELEHVINTKQAELFNEDNFEKSCVLNSEIAEFASIINDLQIWYRVGQDVYGDRQHR